MAIELLDALRGRISEKSVILLASIFLLLANFKAIARYNLFLSGPHNLAVKEQLSLVGWINDHLKPEDGSIGLHPLGYGYHLPKFHIVDFLGKAEKHIAQLEPKFGPVGHNKWDYDYAFSTYKIIAVPHHISPKQVRSDSFKIIEKDFMFQEVSAKYIVDNKNYVFIEPRNFGNTEYGLYVSRDLLKSLPKNITFQE